MATTDELFGYWTTKWLALMDLPPTLWIYILKRLDYDVRSVKQRTVDFAQSMDSANLYA